MEKFLQKRHVCHASTLALPALCHLPDSGEVAGTAHFLSLISQENFAIRKAAGEIRKQGRS
jgi:hypothetical protein